MIRLLRPAVAMALAAGLSVANLPGPSTDQLAGAPPPGVPSATSGDAYRLENLVLLRETVRFVRDSYVDPSRIDPERMFAAALDAVESLVPEVLFRVEGDVLVARIGGHRETLPLDPVRRVEDLPDRLAPIVALLVRHLDPRDIPDPDDHLDPLAMVEFAFANGMLSTLDPHSMLLPPTASKEMDVENRGEFGGLGVNLILREGHLVIDYPVPGTPAHAAGLQPGDEIRRVDGAPTLNLTMTEAIELLRGPVGGRVALEIVREGVPAPFEVSLTRANIELSPVETFRLTGGFGYARIRTFHSSVAADLEAGLSGLTRREGPLRGLVLDLRGNPGGYLTQAIDVADLFLDEGEIVATRGPRDSKPRAELAERGGTFDPLPLVVLVDAGSASASEIVAGALRNHERAVIVGERTFGKGSVQNLHALSYDSKLKITIAQYLTPGERSIQSVGIPADVELVPAVVGPRSDDRLGKYPAVTLFSREDVRREADLDDHLDGVDEAAAAPTWTLRHLAGWEVRQDHPHEPPDARTDVGLRVALGLLGVAPAPRRPEMLAAADSVLARERAAEDARIAEAMGKIGVDWRAGPDVDPASARVEVAVDLGRDGVLRAGEAETVVVTVTNRSEAPLFRVVLKAEEHDLFAGRELPIGYLAPGAARSWRMPVQPDAGHPAEDVPLRFSVRAGSGAEVAAIDRSVRTEARTLPQLAWTWRIEEPEDGVIEVGDRLRIHLAVENVGEGPTLRAEARVRNRSGRALDLLEGTLEIGAPRGPDGLACAVQVASAAALPPAGSRPACRRELRPGERFEGDFTVVVQEPMLGPYGLVLSVGDREAFDREAVVHGGLGVMPDHEEEIRFSLGAAPTAPSRKVLPKISLSRALPLVADGPRLTLSGAAEDPDGVDHVLVYLDDDKVLYQGHPVGAGISRVPFSVDLSLKPGRNTVIVVASGEDGLTSSRSQVVYLPP